MVLTRLQAQAFYDRFGSKQDSQAFYEDAALDDLIAHADFMGAQSVFEFGCGTGRFAARLLKDHLSTTATYIGIDLSTTMSNIATRRLVDYSTRAFVIQSGGAAQFPLADHSVDRIVSTYVLDLLSDTDLQQVISEASRVLKPNGKLCLVSLTDGMTTVSRVVSFLWSGLFRLNAQWVGGCRPIQLAPLLNQEAWAIEYHNLVTQFGVPSEVLIAHPNNGQAQSITAPA